MKRWLSLSLLACTALALESVGLSASPQHYYGSCPCTAEAGGALAYNDCVDSAGFSVTKSNGNCEDPTNGCVAKPCSFRLRLFVLLSDESCSTVLANSGGIIPSPPGSFTFSTPVDLGCQSSEYYILTVNDDGVIYVSMTCSDCG